MSMLYKNVCVCNWCVCVLVKRELLHTGIIDLAHVEGMKQNVYTLFFFKFLFLMTNDWDG